ncbi:DUF2844 domain-containing protein [Xylophilus sp. GW821-FHT01B05]
MKNLIRHPAGLLLALSLSGPAMAALGQNATSVDTDRQQMRASALRSTSSSTYTVHEYTLDSGTVVREYAQSSGKVFAVAWEGPFMPNLQQLLGNEHFATYAEAASSRGRSGGALVLQKSSLVFRSTGHMRAFSGQAYLSNQLPQGVNVEDIR